MATALGHPRCGRHRGDGRRRHRRDAGQRRGRGRRPATPARAAAFAASHGVARSYGSYAELVADPDVDVVYIATTHAQHHEHALLALQAGKPVLVEKAFTLNAREAREVVALARSRRLFCMEAMWLRFIR